MLGILNFSAAPKVSAAATPALDGTKHGPEEALGSFGALLAQIATGEGDEVAGADGRLTQLAAMLGQFRSEAQESLAEVFPDGVIVPGAEFNNWAKAMLIRLDTMLQGAGASAADLARVLDPMEGLLAGDDAGRLLTQAAQTLMGQTPGMATGQAGQGAATADTLHLPEGVDLPDAAQVRAMFRAAADGTAEGASTTVDQAAVKAAALGNVAGAGGAEAEPATGAPLPDALRILLAQAVAAPADRALPPEVQTILSTPQANPAPLVNVVAATPAAPPAQTPAPAQHNGFARNLAGQIRGVSFSEGTTRIELTPQGLGKLEIEISPDEAGKLRVVIRAENPAVLNAMRSDREMLAGLLRDGGTSVDDSAMSFEDLGQRRGTAGQDEAGTLAASAPPVADEDELPQETAPPVGDGRLNILT